MTHHGRHVFVGLLVAIPKNQFSTYRTISQHIIPDFAYKVIFCLTELGQIPLVLGHF